MNEETFTVKNSNEIFKMVLFLTGIMAVISGILDMTIANGAETLMYISFTLLLLPFWIGAVWSKRYRITVNGSRITVKKAFGRAYSVDVSDIESIKWIKNETKMGRMENIKIKAKGHSFHVETLMSNSEKMAEYLKKNVDSSKIDTINNKFEEEE